MLDLRKALADIKSIRSQVARGARFRGYGPATVRAHGNFFDRFALLRSAMLAFGLATRRWPKFELSARVQVLLVIVCVVGASMLGWSVFKTTFYRAAVPAQIELAFELPTMGSDTSYWEAALPIRHKACGGVIFRLNDGTLRRIRDRGINALDDARQGRGYADQADRLFYYYSYKPWQPAPLPPEWTSAGMWLGLYCMNLGNRFARGIVEVAQAPGSFYTTGASKMLLLAPSLELLIYTYTN
jgi:hypothetical protein